MPETGLFSKALPGTTPCSFLSVTTSPLTVSFPLRDRWTDIQVFVNNTFSVSQPSQGVATFDCLDENGKLYDNRLPGSLRRRPSYITGH